MVDVEHPQTRWISIPEPFEWLLRVKWLPDSRRVAVETMNRMQTELRLYFARRRQRTGETYFDGKRSGLGECNRRSLLST